MKIRQRIVMSGTILAVTIVFALPSWSAIRGDVVIKRYAENATVPPAVFSHWFHRIRYKCYACHPSIFEMKAGSRMTMDEIGEGKACGVCHNGKTAWGVSFDTCNKCHLEP